MSSLAQAGFAFFILVLFIGIYLSLFGLPGALLVFINVLIYALATGFTTVGWKVLLFLFIFSVLAEGIDILLGMTKAHNAPLMASSFLSAAIGGVLGMIILTPFFWGPGAWGGFFLGGLAGLIIMELIRQSRLKVPHQAPYSAILAMIGQKTLKGFFTLTMIFASLNNIYS